MGDVAVQRGWVSKNVTNCAKKFAKNPRGALRRTESALDDGEVDEARWWLLELASFSGREAQIGLAQAGAKMARLAARLYFRRCGARRA